MIGVPQNFYSVASRSALYHTNDAALPASLSSQTIMRQVDTGQAAGNSQDSEVCMFSSVTSLNVRLSALLDKHANKGVVTSELWGQVKRCSVVSS